MTCFRHFIPFYSVLLIYIQVISEVVLNGKIDLKEMLILELPALGKT